MTPVIPACFFSVVFCFVFFFIKIGVILFIPPNLNDKRKSATDSADEASLIHLKYAKNETQMQKQVCTVYEKASVNNRTCQKCLANF